MPTPPRPKKTSDARYNQLWYLHELSVDLDNNEVYLFPNESHATGYGDDAPGEPGIEYTMVNRFIRNYNLLRHKNKDPILIHMKSCGGFWEEGMAIYDTIKQSPNPAVVLSYTHARSMSSLIFLAADKGVMMPHSTFMVHRGSVYSGGTGTQYMTDAEEWKKANEQMMKIYVERLRTHGSMQGKSKKVIRNWLDRQMDKKEDVYFSAEEAVEIGFADEIFDGDWDRLREV